MIKVAFPFVGDTIGGSHVSSSALISGLPAYGFAPTAIVHRDGPLQEWLSASQIDVARADLPFLSSDAGGPSALARMAMIAPKLARYLRKNEFGLVHTNDGRMHNTWLAAARLAGIPSIAHQRTRWAPSRLRHLSFKSAGHVIAISDFVRETMPVDIASRTIVVANPFAPRSVERLDARANLIKLTGWQPPFVAFIGTLQAQKRPDVFLRAAAEIHRYRRDVKFILIGRLENSDHELRQLASTLGLGDAVFFTGFRSDVEHLLAGCDLLLAPAVDEGHGRALVEAMFATVPVIAAASGGHLEIIHHNETGLLVPPDDTDALAKAAIDLLNHPDTAQQLAHHAHSWAKTEFTPDNHVGAIAALYGKILKPE